MRFRRKNTKRYLHLTVREDLVDSKTVLRFYTFQTITSQSNHLTLERREEDFQRLQRVH